MSPVVWKSCARGKVEFYGFGMQIRGGRYGAVMIAVTLCVLVSGCTTEDSVGGGNTQAAPTSASATEAPAFASEEEALAAAEEAYAAFLQVSDQISADGGSRADRIDEFVADAYRSEVRAGFDYLRSERLHTNGDTAFDSMRLQQSAISEGSALQVSAYLCIDVGHVRVLDEKDNDVTPSDRKTRLPLEVEFVLAGGTQPVKLQLARSESWTGNDFCEG